MSEGNLIGKPLVTLGVLGASVASLSCYLWKFRNKFNGSSQLAPIQPNSADFLSLIPEKWIRVGTVSQIIIYPIKSIQGLPVEEAELTQIGLKVSNTINDRILMLVDENGIYQSQTRIPKLAFFTLQVNGDTFTVESPDGKSISFKLPQDTPEARRSDARIFTDRNMEALDCGDDVANWFSEATGKKLRLYYHNQSQTQRKINKEQSQYPGFIQSDLGAWQNESAFMMMTEESVEELNRVLPEKNFTIKNFRPTILVKVSSGQPFAENNWGYVRIGNQNAMMKMARPCPRCKLTTIDQNTGKFDQDSDPLTTLVKMAPEIGNYETRRLMRTQAVMGIRLGLLSPEFQGQVIRAGDPVYVATL